MTTDLAAMVSRLPVIDADGEVSDLSTADPALFRPYSELPASLKAKLPGRPKAALKDWLEQHPQA